MSLLPRREDMYWADATAPDGFLLDGMRYDRQAVANGARVAEGDKVFVARTTHGLTPGRRRGMVILQSSHGGRQRGMSRDFFGSGAIVTLVAWIQSNAGSGQNAVGGRVNSSLLDPRNETTDWRLPTGVTEGADNPGLRAYGLARANVPTRNWETGDLAGGETDCYVTAWPRQEEGGSIGLYVGAWRVSDRVPLWERSTGSGFGYTNPAHPVHARFFLDPLTGWGHVIERANNSSPQKITSACSEGKYNSSDISRAASGGLNLANASFNSFFITVGEGEEAVTEIQSYIFCPAHPSMSSSGVASVDFLKMDQSNGEWESHSSYDPALIPFGGPSEIPDLLAYGLENGGPPPWRVGEALAFVSGGVKEIFGGTTWSKVNWTLRAIKTNGTPGDFVVHKTVEAVNNPTVLSQCSLKTQIAGIDHPIQWIDSFPYNLGFWRGGLRVDNSTSNSSWQVFKDAPPILLPYSDPNNNRLAGITNRLCSVWPPTKKNCGGGIVVDKDAEGGEHVAFCVLEPEQFLYAQGYAPTPVPSYEDPNLEEVTDQLQTYQFHYRSYNPCTGTILTADGYRTDTIVPHGSSPSVAPGSPYSDTVPCFAEGYGSGTTERTYSVDDEGLHKQIYNNWIQQVGACYRTKLIVVAPDGTYREKDISQLLEVSHSIVARGSTNYVGGGAPTTITGTDSSFPVADNVWQILLYIKLGLAIILRDLHADGINNNPTPHIEVWDISGEVFSKLSTVRLGSYSELKATDDTSGSFNWRAGDQEWNPYSHGPPRMKGCLDSSGQPQLLAIVGENKKITSSQSGFKRVCYALISLTTPSDPDVLRHAVTSPDEGVGNSGDVETDWPLWWEWDSLILTPGHVAWIKDSRFRESIT